MRILPALLFLAFLAGCASNSLENPNLQAPVATDRAEVVGSKIIGEGGIPHQIYVSSLDGKHLTYNAVDLTQRIWPIEPGAHVFGVSYAGSSGRVFIKPFVADGVIKASLPPGHRYMVKLRAVGRDQIVFFLEDTADRKEAAASEPVALVDVPLPLSVPR